MDAPSPLLPAYAAAVTLYFALSAMAQTPGETAQSGSAVVMPEEQTLEEVTIAAPEPRYVAPTTRDRIGRVWVPVKINGKGPFRLVLDSGATHTALTSRVVGMLGLDPAKAPKVMLRGVTGSAETQTVIVDSLEVGDLWLGRSQMPIIDDAFGGAEGLLGTEGLQTRRIHIAFRHDYIDVRTSRSQRAPSGFNVIPLRRDAGRLLVVDATVAGVSAIAIIDTGAQGTLANESLRTALNRRFRHAIPVREEIIGVTGQIHSGDSLVISPIWVSELAMRNVRVTFGELPIFSHWGLDRRPAILLGMDVLGLLDTLIIDYTRRELQVRMVAGR